MNTTPVIKKNLMKNERTSMLLDIELQKISKKTAEKQFEDWKNKCICLDLNTITPLSEAYDNYCAFIHETYQTISLSKNIFSRLLRFLLSEEQKNKKVIFFTKSKVYIKGIKLIEFNFDMKKDIAKEETIENCLVKFFLDEYKSDIQSNNLLFLSEIYHSVVTKQPEKIEALKRKLEKSYSDKSKNEV